MSDTTSRSASTLQTRGGAAGMLLAAIAFAALLLTGETSRHILAIPVAAGVAAWFVLARALTDPERRNVFYFAFALHAFFWLYAYETYQYTAGTKIFPLFVGYIGLVLTAFDVLTITRTRVGRVVNTFFGTALSEPAEDHSDLKGEVAVLLWLGGLLLAIWLLGFLIGGPLIVLAWMRARGRKSYRSCAYVALGTLAFLWVMFELFLSYELYRGIIVQQIMTALGS